MNGFPLAPPAASRAKHRSGEAVPVGAILPQLGLKKIDAIVRAPESRRWLGELWRAIAICCNVLVSYDLRGARNRIQRDFVMPLIIAVAFFMIADMDAPRHGVIRVRPENLISLSNSPPMR